LVVKGYTQINNLDYFETFSPTTKLNFIRFILSVATSKCWFLEQLGVNNVFIHGDLQEKVYMIPPPGLHLSNPQQVCKLQNFIYGLKQASRE